MPVDYICTVPRVAPSWNLYQGWHWTRQEKERLAFQQDLDHVLHEKGNVCPRGLARVELRYVVTYTLDRDRDSDNSGAVLHKWSQDTLVYAGVIPKDTADRCTSFPPRLQQGEVPQTLVLLRGWYEHEASSEGVGGLKR